MDIFFIRLFLNWILNKHGSFKEARNGVIYFVPFDFYINTMR